nr:hypothetical protein [uncultured Desulfobacter sp.]
MARKSMPSYFIKIITTAFCLAVLAVFQVQAANAPRLNLFPSDVTEHLSNTGAVAGAMEESLKSVIQDLETQSRLYNETGCQRSNDPGCSAIANQISNKYSEMLSIMKENLPEMKQAIRATNNGIGKNLRKELGRKTTPSDIQALLSNNAKPKVFKGRYSLSSRFAKYHKMISSGSKNTLATLAAEIYLDSREVLNMIDMMEAEIAQQQTLIKLGSMYGTLTPEMMSTVDAVKTVIFGEPEDQGGILPAAGDVGTGTFKSPLEMD